MRRIEQRVRSHRAPRRRALSWVAAALLAGCVGTPPPERQAPQRRPLPPPLPDSTGWGTHVLSLGMDGEGSLWAGTYGQGIYVLRGDSRTWAHSVAQADVATSISWDFVNAFAFPADGSIWYGTVGNGFGRSIDGGQTWSNWTIDALGPAWQYVAHRGMDARGDTVYIATADGLRITWDGGRTWRCVTAAVEVPGVSPDSREQCGERIRALPSKYLLSLEVAPDGNIWVGHLKGLSVSRDAGRSWTHLGAEQGVPAARVRAVAATPDSMIWFATEEKIYVDSLTGQFVEATIRLPGWNGLPGRPREIVATPSASEPSIVLSFGMAAGDGFGNFRMYYVAAGDEYRPGADMWTMVWWGPPLWPIGGSAVGLSRVLAGNGLRPDLSGVRPAAAPTDPRHTWFQRPIADDDGNPYIDPTYRYGSTMGGNFQQHQGVEFNNPAGTPVRAIGAGVVVFAGPAEAGSNTVAIRHDRRWQDQYVYSTYYHNTSLDVRAGQRVAAGDIVARAGNTGRATNDHLHLEVHVAPSEDSAAIVNAEERFPPFTVNPELWIEPLPGTGIVAGRVTDSAGQPVRGARVYGLVKPYPVETPYSFAETYGDRAHSDPAYGEHFAVGDVPAGDYLLGVEIEGHRVWRRIRVAPGRITFVEFTP